MGHQRQIPRSFTRWRRRRRLLPRPASCLMTMVNFLPLPSPPPRLENSPDYDSTERRNMLCHNNPTNNSTDKKSRKKMKKSKFISVLDVEKRVVYMLIQNLNKNN